MVGHSSDCGSDAVGAVIAAMAALAFSNCGIGVIIVLVVSVQ